MLFFNCFSRCANRAARLVTRYRMGSLNLQLAKLRAHWTGAPRPTQMVIVATVAIALILAAYGISWKSVASYEPLFSGRTFSQQEMMAVQTALGRSGLGDYRSGKAQNGHATLLVPPAQRAAYIAAVVEGNALPLNFDLDLKEALNKTSPFESSAQWQARVQLAKQRELAKILCSMSEIDDASVQFDEEVNGGLRNERRVRAMVVVRPHADVDLDASRIRSIRQLVAASKAFLSPTDVTVFDLKTGVSHPGARDLNPALVQSDEYAIRKAKHEREWAAKIKQVLGSIPGVEVATNVELGFPGSADLEMVPDYGSLHPSSITVSVGIPHSYYAKVRQASGVRLPQAAPNAASIRRIEAETAAKVRQLVTALFPSNLAPESTKVAVATFTDLRVTESEQTRTAWIASTLRNPLAVCCMLGVAAIAVLLGYGIWQDIQEHRLQLQLAEANRQGVATPVSVVAFEDSMDVRCEPETPIDQQAFESASGAIHEELTQLVRDDPDAAAEMLGEWVRKAS